MSKGSNPSKASKASKASNQPEIGTATAEQDDDGADRVVISYPADLSDWGRHQITTRYFRSYLRRTLETPEPGEVREEFVGVGCCGDTLDVPLRIERIEGGRRAGEGTDVVYEVRDSCEVEGGWQVQSAE